MIYDFLKILREFESFLNTVTPMLVAKFSANIIVNANNRLSKLKILEASKKVKIVFNILVKSESTRRTISEINAADELFKN